MIDKAVAQVLPDKVNAGNPALYKEKDMETLSQQSHSVDRPKAHLHRKHEALTSCHRDRPR